MTDASVASALPAPTLLKLIWLASPALPVGGFSYSEGLEAAVDAGRVNDETQARAWLLDQLVLLLERADLAVVAQALSAWQMHDTARLAELNDWQLRTRDTVEMRRQTEQMGRSLLEWLKALGHAGGPAAGATAPPGTDPRLAMLAAMRPAPCYPVAFALAAALAGADARHALLAFAFGWAENMVQAAIRAVPLGQGAGQRILAGLAEAIPSSVESALRLSDEQRQSLAPSLSILSARHEIQYSRLFRS